MTNDSMPYHVNVPSPEEEDMSYYDETKELVKLLGAPFMNPGAWVSHWDANYTEVKFW